MPTAAAPSYRYERKFLVSELDAGQVRMLVKRHPGMFYEPYPPRYINNIYLDSEELENYNQNVSGIGERHKVRVRWYAGLFGNISSPVLEFKVKDGLVGAKYSYPLPPFQFEHGFDQRSFQELIRRAELPEQVKLYLRGLNVVLCNRYYRWYYVVRDQRFRVTVDTDMVYYQVKKDRNRFRRKYPDHKHVVVELKYEKPFDDIADRMAGFFPFSLSRNSKYVTGIEMVYL
ncbi:MAG: polyphosphate polymerase domain-containing protein [Anaerolineales bacterium]|nr:polyphosphate polymerase domain-containing protein [Anaerolineales bacterium]